MTNNFMQNLAAFSWANDSVQRSNHAVLNWEDSQGRKIKEQEEQEYEERDGKHNNKIRMSVKRG